MRRCDVCGLPSETLVRGRCIACIVSDKGHVFRFLNIPGAEKMKALLPPLIAIALGVSLMVLSDISALLTVWMWGIGFLLLTVGIATLPLVLFFGPVDWL